MVAERSSMRARGERRLRTQAKATSAPKARRRARRRGNGHRRRRAPRPSARPAPRRCARVQHADAVDDVVGPGPVDDVAQQLGGGEGDEHADDGADERGGGVGVAMSRANHQPTARTIANSPIPPLTYVTASGCNQPLRVSKSLTVRNSQVSIRCWPSGRQADAPSPTGALARLRRGPQVGPAGRRTATPRRPRPRRRAVR
jgi:hypothetical protein